MAVVFGIGIASVGIGGQLSVALAMNLTPSFHVGAGWVNGSIFATASFLFWSDSWTLLGPAVIYSWTDPPPALPGAPLAASGSTYDNGTNSTWTVGSRYYAGSGYDVHVWDPSLTTGPAISDIYPHTQVAGAAGYNGGYLFYTRDDPSLPVDQGLTVAGARLDPSTNALTGLPSPNDPNFVIERPRATTLPDGSLNVVWAALTQSETTLASPTDHTRHDLQGARFYPGNSTWGPVTTWTNSGILEAYQVDGSRPGGSVVALVAPSFLVGPTTAERLVQIDLATGREVSNASVTGLSQILSVRSGLGEAVVQDVGGNFSVVNLSSAAVVPVPVSAGAGAHLIGESFALGSAATLLLLFRNPNASELVLVDARTGQAIANRTVDGSATDPTAVEANGTYYVFASEQAGIEGWRVAGETFYNHTLIPEANDQSFGLVQAGASLVVYALVSNGALTQPILSLDLTEVGATLPAVPTPVSASTSPSSSKGPGSSTYLLYLGIVALAEALLLGVWAVRGRRQAPPAGPTLPPSASPGAAPSPSVPPQGPSEPPDAPPPEG